MPMPMSMFVSIGAVLIPAPGQGSGDGQNGRPGRRAARGAPRPTTARGGDRPLVDAEGRGVRRGDGKPHGPGGDVHPGNRQRRRETEE